MVTSKAFMKWEMPIKEDIDIPLFHPAKLPTKYTNFIPTEVPLEHSQFYNQQNNYRQ